VLGIDPAENVASAARERGVPTLAEFFGRDLAGRVVAEQGRADLVIGNNVLAQVPDLNDFVAGVAILLADQGVATFEFPHLMKLIAELQYDTIYHEHFSYFSLGALAVTFARHGLAVTDVEEIPTHGGSLRVYVEHLDASATPAASVERVLREEDEAGLRALAGYSEFASGVMESKRRLLRLLCSLRTEGHVVAGYGAPGKGNTLLNYCGIRADFIDFTVDRNPYKHGRFLPGTHIPIYPPEHLDKLRPDYIFILPWNLKDEIMTQLAYARDWGAKFIVPIPEATVL
jgi:hypothetical protein